MDERDNDYEGKDVALYTPQAPTSKSALAIMSDPVQMHSLIEFSKLMAEAVVMVPKHLIGKPADCMAICMQALQWGMNPFVVAQKTHVVNGGLGYEAQLVNAVLQASGEVISRPHYTFEGTGADLECRVGFVLKGETEITWGEWLRSGDVKVKNSPLWQTNPSQQMGYLQIKNWARMYCPQAILGIRTPDELELINPDTGEMERPARGPRRKSEKHMGPVEEVKAPAPPAAAPSPADAVHPAPAPTPVAAPTPAPAPAPAHKDGAGISGSQVAWLRNKLKATGVDEPTVCDRFQVASIELLGPEQFAALKSELIAML